MEHAGVGLPASERQEFNDIQQELATLSTTVNNNVLDSTKKFRLTFTNKNELKGLPETALNLASNMYASDSVDDAPGKYISDAVSSVAVIIVRIVFIRCTSTSSFLFYCLFSNRSFPNKPKQDY